MSTVPYSAFVPPRLPLEEGMAMIDSGNICPDDACATDWLARTSWADDSGFIGVGMFLLKNHTNLSLRPRSRQASKNMPLCSARMCLEAVSASYTWFPYIWTDFSYSGCSRPTDILILSSRICFTLYPTLVHMREDIHGPVRAPKCIVARCHYMWLPSPHPSLRNHNENGSKSAALLALCMLRCSNLWRRFSSCGSLEWAPTRLAETDPGIAQYAGMRSADLPWLNQGPRVVQQGCPRISLFPFHLSQCDFHNYDM